MTACEETLAKVPRATDERLAKAEEPGATEDTTFEKVDRRLRLSPGPGGCNSCSVDPTSTALMSNGSFH